MLGDGNFIKWVKETFLSERDDEKEISQLKKLKPRVAIEDVVLSVAQEFRCSQDQVTAKGRKNNKAREVAIHLCRDMSGLSCKDLGFYFGGVSGALITTMHKRIADEVAQNRKLKRRIESIKKRIFNI